MRLGCRPNAGAGIFRAPKRAPSAPRMCRPNKVRLEVAGRWGAHGLVSAPQAGASRSGKPCFWRIPQSTRRARHRTRGRRFPLERFQGPSRHSLDRIPSRGRNRFAPALDAEYHLSAPPRPRGPPFRVFQPQGQYRLETGSVPRQSRFLSDFGAHVPSGPIRPGGSEKKPDLATLGTWPPTDVPRQGPHESCNPPANDL